MCLAVSKGRARPGADEHSGAKGHSGAKAAHVGTPQVGPAASFGGSRVGGNKTASGEGGRGLDVPGWGPGQNTWIFYEREKDAKCVKQWTRSQ